MATTLITKNSVTASKRPTPAQLVTGELGLNADPTDFGLYFEDSAGDIRKVGGCIYSANAPNSTPAGEIGNSTGELWYDTVNAHFKLWDGTQWDFAAGTVLSVDIAGENGIIATGGPVVDTGVITVTFDITSLPVLP